MEQTIKPWRILVLTISSGIFASCANMDFSRYRWNSEPAPKEYNSSRTLISWPVKKIRITQRFKNRKNPSHEGIDLAGPLGTPIHSAHRGKVSYAGRHFSGYGRMVIVEDGYGWASIYSHLNRIIVKQGQWVRKGSILGTMGKSGRTTGVHLHFELRENNKPVNPLAYLPN